MDREEQSDIEVIRIWPGQRERTRTMQSQQLQLGTNRGTSGAITAQTKEEAICQLINTHNPFSGMCCDYSTTSHAETKIEKQQTSHRRNGNKASALPFTLVGISLENMILSHTDIIWERYIAAAFNAKVSEGTLPSADISVVNAKKPPSFYLTRQSHTSRYRSLAAQSSYRPCSKESIHAMEHIWDWERGVKTDSLKRKAAPIGTEEVSAKQAYYSFSKSRDTPNLFIQVVESRSKTFYARFENSVQTPETCLTDLCNFAKRYPEKQYFLEETRNVNTQIQICECTRDGYETCSVKCSLASVLKHSRLGEIDVHASNFIPETDSLVDYTVPYSSLTQTGHRKAQTDSKGSLFLKAGIDSSINRHGSSSQYPQMASNVIFNNGDDKPIKSQPQLLCKWVSHEKSAISENTLTRSVLLQKTDLSFIDEEKCHFGSKLFLSTETSLPVWLNQGAKLKRYSLPNISSSVLADSYRCSINNFACSQRSISQVEWFPQTLQHLPKMHSNKAEQMEMEVTLGQETKNKITVDYKTALKDQVLGFPSHLLGAVGNSDEYTPIMFPGSSCPKQAFLEKFDKISLDMLELQCDNPVEENFLHIEKMRCQIQTFPDSSVVVKNEFRGCEFYVTPKLHCNEVCTIASDCIEGKTGLQVVTAHEDGTKHDLNLGIQNGRKQKTMDIINKTKSEAEEHNETLKFNSSNEAINTNKLSVNTANGFLSETMLNAVIKEEHDNVNELQAKGIYSLVNSETCDCNLSSADHSLECSAAIDVTNLSTEESTGLTFPVFEMKAQFDLVLEELKLFHVIGQSNEKPFIADDKKGIEQMCCPLPELQDILTGDVPCDPGMNGGDSGFQHKTLIKAKEQEVPQASWSASSADEESLYSADRAGNSTKAFSWTPSFMTYGEKVINQHNDKEVTFSHGIGRVTPLKTRSGPLRIGLSKKAKIKQLHPYLR